VIHSKRRTHPGTPPAQASSLRRFQGDEITPGNQMPAHFVETVGLKWNLTVTLI